MTETLRLNAADVAEAAALLRQGGIVAFPTETVYGLGADATSDLAVAKVFAAKGRPSFNPLIVHVPDLAAAERYAVVSERARELARAFWPGPLTLVLPLQSSAGIAPLVTAGLESLAIRVPSAPVAKALLRAVDRPVAAPSANPSGRISATSADHVLAGLDGMIDAVLDNGPCAVGVESTIVGMTDEPTLLRPGGIAVEEIEDLLGQPLAAAGAAITAPGQLASHYAPRAPVRLEASAPRDGELFLGFGPMEATLNLSEKGDLLEAAARLFGHLHKLDAMGGPIAVAPVPNTGLGLAINDRLRRAAAPR